MVRRSSFLPLNWNDEVRPTTCMPSMRASSPSPIPVSTDADAAGPASSTPMTDISFEFTGTDNLAVAGFQCALDLAVFSSCTSTKLYSGLALGQHTFRVRAVDTAGNADPTPTVFAWTIVSPAQAAQNLFEMLVNMSLTPQVTNPLLGHLAQLEEILNDENPTNDVGGCKILAAFVTFVNERSEKGDISASNAAALVESAGDIAYALGCG